MMRSRDGRRSPCWGALVVVGVAVLGLIAAGCGDDDAGEAASEAPGASDVDVGVREGTAAGTVLVDRTGMTLYTPDQEAGGTILCVEDCAEIWPPLTVESDTPSAADAVSAALGTVARPDGTVQVTYEGKPLYRFSLDSAPGDVAGEGVADAFGGTEFVWHAVATDAASGQAPPPPSAPEVDYGY